MTSSQLRACAAIVQCSRVAGAPALADALWKLADQQDQEDLDAERC